MTFSHIGLMTDQTLDVAGLRARLGWTQQQLAEYCGVDRSTVSTWEARAPTKGPALVLLRQLDASSAAPAAPSSAGVAA